MSRSPEFEAARRETVDALSVWFRDRMDALMMAAAPVWPVENPTMREFTAGQVYSDLALDSFQSKPKLISATIMDTPFAITHGEWYYAQFQAGDYLCFDFNGKPFGMTPERFHAEFDAIDQRVGPSVTYRASFLENGSVLLEPSS